MDPRTTTTPLTPASNAQPADLPPINAPVEKSSFFKSKKGIGIIAASLLVVVLVITGILFFTYSKKPQTQTPQTSIKPNESQNEDIKTYPKFEFTYEEPSYIPTAASTSAIYTLKDSFTDAELTSIGTTFGLSAPISKADNMAVYSSMDNPKTRGFLYFDMKTGMFNYQNFGSSIKILGDYKTGAKQSPYTMTKKTPPRIGTTDKGNEDENYKYRYFGGFWK
ncbi:MAG: hypothetical protein KA035_04390, partial [Candidatus Levybacteria bacterium]|nr:hypothetical protein [Candidatus Levybacteria bacterium]